MNIYESSVQLLKAIQGGASYDTLLLDVMMDEMGGVTVYRNQSGGCSESNFTYAHGNAQQIPVISHIAESGICTVCGAVDESILMVLPAALDIIDEEAFLGAALQYVKASEGITEIRARAFADSSLSIISLPESVTFIADSAAVSAKRSESSFG